jgi:hypothetical protein
VPAVALACRQPGDRPERACDPRTDHGRLCADGEHVRRDPGECADLAEPPRQAHEPGEPEDADRDEHDVRPADRK